jgi:hypothetical protein
MQANPAAGNTLDLQSNMADQGLALAIYAKNYAKLR